MPHVVPNVRLHFPPEDPESFILRVLATCSMFIPKVDMLNSWISHIIYETRVKLIQCLCAFAQRLTSPCSRLTAPTPTAPSGSPTATGAACGTRRTTNSKSQKVHHCVCLCASLSMQDVSMKTFNTIKGVLTPSCPFPAAAYIRFHLISPVIQKSAKK